MPSAGTEACAHQAVIVGHGTLAVTEAAAIQAALQRELLSWGGFFGTSDIHPVNHGKVPNNRWVIKPEELRLYFLLQGITKCLIKPPNPTDF